MPTIAPTALKIIEEKEIKPEPHSRGIKLPAVEPTTMPIQITDFDSIFKQYSKS